MVLLAVIKFAVSWQHFEVVEYAVMHCPIARYIATNLEETEIL